MKNAGAEMQAAVEVRQVSKRYGEHDVQALQDVSLLVPRGKFIALMGPSGCGKSTLLNCIGGLDVVSGGKIFIGGADVSGLDEAALTELRRHKIGFVFQFFNLLSTLTVRENISLPLELAGKLSRHEIRKRTDELLSEVGLTPRADFYPSQLSGGEMQRAAVIRAMSHRPQVILADEPTGNLDTDNGNNILGLLQSLCKQRGETILMATHSQDAAAYADAVVRMKDGRIIETVPV
ncbi:MAG TPA: ABC transporter ATP-binding protein [Candidatus Obscuribacterales bacterium]